MSKSFRNLLAGSGLLAIAALAATGLLLIGGTPAHAACQISGPTTASVNQAFSLCGPSISGSTFEWSGPGISTNTYSRCVSVDGLAQGGYEFVLVRRINGAVVERCTRVVNVGSSTGGVESCAITGPETINEGTTATLCAPQDGLHSYSWVAPGGATSTAACITVTEEGTYTLTSRNRITGSSRTCSRLLTVNGYDNNNGNNGNNSNCDVSGPTTIPTGSRVQICGPSYSNVSFAWTGPGNFSSTNRCINVVNAGNYVLTTRNQNTGRTTRCTQTMLAEDQGGYDDPDSPISDNCPRDLQFWRGALGTTGSNGGTELSRSELLALARSVDNRSAYLNWSNDVDGLRVALSPAQSSLTRRKQVIRQYAAMLANVAAGEANLTSDDGNNIGLEMDTAVNFGGARTVGELIALTDRLLAANRGDFSKLNATLTQINRGRGIGSTCQ